MLPKQVNKNFRISDCRPLSIVAAKNLHIVINETSYQTVSKSERYYLSFIQNKIFRIITWIYKAMDGLSMSLLASDFTQVTKKYQIFCWLEFWAHKWGFKP